MRSSTLLAAILALSAPGLVSAAPKKAAAATKAPAKAAPKKKAAPPLSAEHKKALMELYGGFKFGMTKDDVLGVLQKQIDERYEDKIKATTDITTQDRLRKDKKAELARSSSTYVSFDGHKTGWDVSIIENEFAHNTGESMMERWENEGGKNNRRFFFFKDGKLWKMFVSLDVSVLPEDKKNFATLEQYMEQKYGAGDIDIESGQITWRAGEFDARAVDRLKDYDAIGIAIEDPKVRTEVLAEREQHAPPKKETPAVIKAVLDTDGKDHPDVKSNGGAVDAVIQAQGGAGTKK
jgi:hypothetical protein